MFRRQARRRPLGLFLLVTVGWSWGWDAVFFLRGWWNTPAVVLFVGGNALLLGGAEEIGWRGFLQRRLQARTSVLTAGLAIGADGDPRPRHCRLYARTANGYAMALRKLVRGRPEWSRIESVVCELATRYGREVVHVRFLEADNWLSTPLVLDDEYFVKLVTEQNSMVHALFTATRNLGAFSAGTEGFFGHFGTPYEMVRHELEATERLREVGVNAPEPVEALEIEGIGVLVMEYLPDFDTLDDLDASAERRLAPAVFATLRRMHDHGLAHGDLRAENVLVVDEEVYVIDATNVREAEDDPGASMTAARAYDLACALAALEPAIGAAAAVEAALSQYDLEQLLAAREFLDFVSVRPDHTFAAAELKGEIEKRAGEAQRRR